MLVELLHIYHCYLFLNDFKLTLSTAIMMKFNLSTTIAMNLVIRIMINILTDSHTVTFTFTVKVTVKVLHNVNYQISQYLINYTTYLSALVMDYIVCHEKVLP